MINQITFGIFAGNSLSTSRMYRLTQHDLSVDEDESYWSSRFTKDGYQFSGNPLPKKEFLKLKPLLSSVPEEIFTNTLPAPNRPGNKDERVTYIEVKRNDQHIVCAIDQYDKRDDNLHQKILDFRELLEQYIKKINTKHIP